MRSVMELLIAAFLLLLLLRDVEDPVLELVTVEPVDPFVRGETLVLLLLLLPMLSLTWDLYFRFR